MPLDVTATLGVPGSASTWVFNVARELRWLHHGSTPVESFYSDAVGRARQVFLDNRDLDRTVVLKLHEPDDGWRRFLSDVPAKLVLSIRDPRDAMLSLMERFGEAREIAFDRVSIAMLRIAESLGRPHLRLRYEDRFFDQAQTVAAIARHLGVDLDDSGRDRIFEAYQTERVRHLGQTLGALPPGRRKMVGTTRYDEVTQIHDRHIGDQRTGKWKDQFDAAERRRLSLGFRPFLDMFDYERD